MKAVFKNLHIRYTQFTEMIVFELSLFNANPRFGGFSENNVRKIVKIRRTVMNRELRCADTSVYQNAAE